LYPDVCVVVERGFILEPEWPADFSDLAQISYHAVVKKYPSEDSHWILILHLNWHIQVLQNTHRLVG
jgi:hypothetical protein